jgi:hypothetical protein
VHARVSHVGAKYSNIQTFKFSVHKLVERKIH